MTARTAILAAILALLVAACASPVARNGDDRARAMSVRASECVVLLHGLGRTWRSMRTMAKAMENRGYAVANRGYPSRDHRIEALAPIAINKGLDGCATADTVHFVTHSMGALVLRQYLATASVNNLGRVVMLAPPNQGTEIVDRLQRVPGHRFFLTPAHLQLGTDESGIAYQLGNRWTSPAALGVIAGTRTSNPILSLFLPNPDDGKVSLERSKLDGMTDFVAVRRTHTFMMNAPDVIAHTLAFLKSGHFDRDLD